MQFSLSIILAVGAILAPALASNCQNSPGVANGECVKYYGGNNCKGTPIGSYKPTCGGNCFQFDSFNNLLAAGDGTYGTDCRVFSDINCQAEMTDTGNVVAGSGKCVNVPNAKSMKCYYRC